MDVGDLRTYLSSGDVCLGIRVNPSAARTRLCGLHGDRLKVAVAAPPEDNRANAELTVALAGWLDLDRDKVRVVKGHASRDKVVAFKGIEDGRLRVLVERALSSGA